jgi:hypothetical protein
MKALEILNKKLLCSTGTATNYGNTDLPVPVPNFSYDGLGKHF